MTLGKKFDKSSIQFNLMNCLHWGEWKGITLQQISVYVTMCGWHLTMVLLSLSACLGSSGMF